ncbi:MAG: ATP-binding protein [Cyclonatronaceae bacterium]
MPEITEHTLRISASTDELERIRHFVADHARNFGFGDDDINDIILAVDEACTNIIKHAYGWQKGKPIHIQLGMRGKEMLITILDEGKPFDPDSYRLPSMQDQLEQKKRSGYGILLIRKLMDHVEYRKRKSRNEIRMTKKR